MKLLSAHGLLRAFVVLACIFSLCVMGCEGKDPVKTVTDTLKEVVGDKAVQKSEEMREQLDKTMKEKARDILKTGEQEKDEDTPGKAGDSPEGEGQ